MTRTPIYVQGMHGMGDCIHQRAILRQLLEKHTVTLETSWASMYHDLIPLGLTLVRRPVALRTQTKNAMRESEAVQFRPIHPSGPSIRVMYHGQHVMQTASKTVLEAMCDVTGTSYAAADFTLPVPEQWFEDLGKLVELPSDKPLLVYRPLVARPEWRGSMARNADPVCYAEIFAAIRDHFYVVSVADLVPGREWVVGPQLNADLALHSGELTFETMAALFSLADLVYTASGFAAILAPAVGTPVVSVGGGYESVHCHSSGAKFAPFLGIETMSPCSCWTSACRQQCDKTIDVPKAIARLDEFLDDYVPQSAPKEDITPRTWQEMHAPAEDSPAEGPPARPFSGNQRQYNNYLMQQRGLAASQATWNKA